MDRVDGGGGGGAITPCDPLTASLEGPGHWPLFVIQQEEQVSVLVVVKRSRWGCGRTDFCVFCDFCCVQFEDKRLEELTCWIVALHANQRKAYNNTPRS